MGADLAVTEVFVSVKNYFSKQPYVTSDGQTSLNIPVEDAEWDEVMWEPKVNEISTGKITLPSLIAQPGLRELCQQIKEGDRVELYHFQPDCGDPIMAGFIPPEGIEEQDGKTILNFEDTLGQLKWQHIRRFEYYNQNASAFYDRARSIWFDLLADDFSLDHPENAYLIGSAGAGPSFGAGFAQVKSVGVNSNAWIQAAGGPAGFGGVSPSAGDVFLLEGDFSLFTAFAANAFVQGALLLQDSTLASARVGGFFGYQPSGVGTFPQQQNSDIEIYPPVGSSYDPGASPHGTNQTSFSMPTTTRRLSVFLQFSASAVTVYTYLDNIQTAFTTQPWSYAAPPGGFYLPTLYLQANNSGDYATCTGWRVRRLTPAILRGARFNPQTPDAVTYQPNDEENLQLLQLFAEKDNAEFRPIYRAWPLVDELELDEAGTLGSYPSRTLGYEVPGTLLVGDAPIAAPFAAVAEIGSFLERTPSGTELQLQLGVLGDVQASDLLVGGQPPFRFEEGFNLASPPRILPKANAHANDVIRVGAATSDSQVFAEKWAAEAAGWPLHDAGQTPPIYPTYPYFEQITNDDRVGIQSLNASLTGFELARRIDPTPSLELEVVDEIPFAGRWRAGDQVLVKTRSLRFNLEQEMRVQRVQYRAGNPMRTVTVGKTDFDPTMLRMLAEDTKISWLYDQSGTNPGIYVYPTLGNILSGATSAVFSIPLDKYTTGSAIIYAALHWFADANVMNIAPIINGTAVYTTGLTAASGTDSDLVIVTQYFQAPGTYQLQFKNNDANTRNLTGAFLVLRVKA